MDLKQKLDSFVGMAPQLNYFTEAFAAPHFGIPREDVDTTMQELVDNGYFETVVGVINPRDEDDIFEISMEDFEEFKKLGHIEHPNTGRKIKLSDAFYIWQGTQKLYSYMKENEVRAILPIIEDAHSTNNGRYGRSPEEHLEDIAYLRKRIQSWKPSPYPEHSPFRKFDSFVLELAKTAVEEHEYNMTRTDTETPELNWGPNGSE
jgi:hypothetical protein